jgi:hypothetical protein
VARNFLDGSFEPQVARGASALIPEPRSARDERVKAAQTQDFAPIMRPLSMATTAPIAPADPRRYTSFR